MTRIDFYVLNENQSGGRNVFACRLIEKIYKQGHSVLLHVPDERQAGVMDDLLWTWRQGSFIPHEPHQSGLQPESPIAINHQPEIATEMQGVLVNMASEIPLFFSQFERVTEIVAQDEQSRQSARQRYRFYQERGYPMETHDIGTNG